MNLIDLEREYQQIARPPATGGFSLDDLEREYQLSTKGGAAAPIPSGDDERGFRSWYADWAQKTGINPDPDDPRHHYDYRAAFKAGAQPAISPEDGRYHWPSQFKAADHPNRFVGGVDTITGKASQPPKIDLGGAAGRRFMGADPNHMPKIEVPEGPVSMGGYALDPSGAAQAGKDVGRAVLQVAAAPGRLAVDASRALWGVLGYPFAKMGERMPLNDGSGRTVADVFYGDQMKGLADLKKRLTFVDEPYSDAALSVALGGGAGAGMRLLKEASSPGAAMLRQVGVTEPLATTAAKSAASALLGDTLVIDPTLKYLDERLEETTLSPQTKQLIAVTAPLILGLVSGATIEAKIDRMLKNPLAVGFLDGMAKAEATPEEVFEKFKQAIDEDVEKRGIGKLAETEQKIRQGADPQAQAKAGKVPEVAAAPFEQQLGDEIDSRLHVRPESAAAGVKSARESAEAFEEAFRQQREAAQQAAARPKRLDEAIDMAVDATTGKSAQQSAQDMAVENELLLNRIYRENLPRAARQAKEQAGLVSTINDVVAGKVPAPNEAGQAVYRSRLDEIEQIAKRPLHYLDKEALIRTKMVTDHAGRKDLSEIIEHQMDVVAARNKAQKAATAKGGETLRWRITQMNGGGIDFLHYKGEAKDIPPMVRRSIARKNGTPIDLAEQTLKDEGWLDDEESLLEVLKYDPQALRRRHLSTELSERKGHLTDREIRQKQLMEAEDEMPEGFEDLPGELQAEVASGRMSMEEALAQSDETPFDDAIEALTAQTRPRAESIRLPDEEKQALIDLNFAGRKRAAELGRPQELVMTGGPPGAGKSSSLRALGVDVKDMVHADADLIKEQAGYADRAAEFHETSSEINKAITRKAIDEGYDLAYDSLLTNFPLADEIIQKTLAKGGKASIAFTNIDAATSVARARARKLSGLSDREIPLDASLKGYNRSLPTFLELFRKYEDNDRVHFVLVDNNVDGRKEVRIFKKDDSGLKIDNQELFDEIINTPYYRVFEKGKVRYERSQRETVESLQQQSDSISSRAQRIADQTRAGRQHRMDQGVEEQGPVPDSAGVPGRRGAPEGQPEVARSSALQDAQRAQAPPRQILSGYGSERSEPGGWHEIKEPHQQLEFEFKFEEKAPQGDTAAGIPDAQRVRMATTGRLRTGSATVRNPAEAASLLADLRKAAQENFYSVAVDKDGNVLEVHRYSKGITNSAQVSAPQVVGRIFNIGPDVKKVYFVHNHPSSSTIASRDDIGIHKVLGRLLALRDIDYDAMVIAGTKYSNFTLGDYVTENAIPPVNRKVSIPIKERLVNRRTIPEKRFSMPSDVKGYLEKHYSGRDGFLFMDSQFRPIGWMDYPKGREMAEGAARLAARAEELNASGLIFNSNTPLTEAKNRAEFIQLVQKGLGGDIRLLDIMEAGRSAMETGHMPRGAIDGGEREDALYNLNRRGPDSILYMHPSTITGPIGGIAAGVDWQEYERSGEIRIDVKKALIGALAGAAAPGALRRMKGLGHDIATKWDKKFAEPFVEAVKNKANGLIVNEDLRHGLGLNRSKEFGNLLRDYYRDVERAWLEAAELGQELAKIAPTKLEQRRLMQIIRGGVTANPQLREKAAQVNAMFAKYREQLQEHNLLQYSRFDKLTRKERAKLRNIIAKDKDLRKIDEQEFLKMHDLTASGIDQEFVPDGPKVIDRVKGAAQEPPEWATERIPLEAYETTPKTSAEWARQKLRDHYHHATAEEYAPLYYDTHEGLTPKQREVLLDEIKRLKVKSRRGNPEGEPVLERQIARLESMLGPGWKERRNLKKARMQLNKRYSHRRIEIPYEIQKILGVIEEAPYPVAKMAGVQKSDVLKGKLFEEVARRSDWAIPTRLKDPVTGEMQRVYGGEPPPNFVKVDDERFGALDGMYVRKDIWDDLREVEEWRGAFTQLWDKTLGAWKYGKVVLNPATHARNFMSNMVLAYMGDVSPADVKTYAKAAKALKRGQSNPYFKEADDWGLFNDTYVSTEIAKLRDELDSLRDPKSVNTWIRRAASLPADVYQTNEKLFKMAVFIKAREAGAGIDEAARKAEKFIFNYADIPPWVKTMKRWVSPFFTFTYKALPLFAEMAIRKPHKVAAIAAAMYGMEEYARRSLGMTEEEQETQRAMLPEWQQRRILGFGPYAQVHMPFRDRWGNDLYLDLAYILPFGNAAEKWGQSALPFSDFMPSNPLFSIGAEILTNRDSFTGREIYNEVLDGTAKVAAKYLEHSWREVAPSMAPGGYGWNKMKTGIENSVFGKDVRDWADRPLELSTAVMSSMFGIKLTPAAERQLKSFELKTRREISREVDKEIGRLKIKRRRNEIDEREFKRQTREMEELKRKLLNERPKP